MIFIPIFLKAQEEVPASSAAAELLATSRENEIEEEVEEFSNANIREKKYNLNTINVKELITIPGIDAEHAKQLVDYRSAMGDFQSIYEIQCVPQWLPAFCRKVRSYFTVSDPAQNTQLLKRVAGGKHLLSILSSMVLQKSSGYTGIDSTGPAFSGSPVRLLLRYRYNNPGKMQWGFLAEKDAGERLFSSAAHGFDHYSYYLMVQKWKGFESLLLGDFRVNLGQGLVQWQSLAFNKSADVVHTMRQGNAIRPNRSATESGFYRGIAASKTFGRFSALAFCSRILTDGNLQADSGSVSHVSSFLTSGLHRTGHELADRKTLEHTAGGMSINYNWRGVKFGLNLVAHKFDKQIQKDEQPYNQFAFTGRNLLNESFDYALPIGNLRVFGEVAFSQPGSVGMVHGVLASIAHNTDLAILYRNISSRYHSFESSAFTEATDPSGERGVFAGLQVKISPILSLSAFADHFYFPFYRYRLNSASRGSDYLVQLKISPDKKTFLTIRFNSKSKANNNADEDFIHNTGMHTRRSFRVQAGYPIGRNIAGTSRMEVAEIREEAYPARTATLIYTEVSARLLSKYSGNLRVQFIDVPDYDSRLYAYESSGAGSGYVKMHYGTGFRVSAQVKKSFLKKFFLWASVNNTVFADDRAMGSGNDRLPGRQKTSISFQFQYNF